MNRAVSLFIVVIFFGCGIQPRQINSKDYEIKAENIHKTLSYLSSDELKGRKTGSAGIEKAARFIENNFKKAGLPPFYETYRDSFMVGNQVAYNLIAYKEGKHPELKNEIVILGAHYDHIGILPEVKNDSIANGANDNASGTTAVLELAKYFSKKETQRSILFILFSAEEMGLLGSSHLSRRMKAEKVDLYTMLNFEMIGVPQENEEFSAYLTGFEISNFSDVFNKATAKNTLGFFEGEKEKQLFGRSDNYPFYLNFFIPAHTISTFTFSNFPHYHQVGDEIEELNIDFMEKLIKEIIPGIFALTESKEKIIHLRQNK